MDAIIKKQFKLIIEDEVNIKFEGLDLETRKKCNRSQKYKDHSAQFTAKGRYGFWDGTVSFFSVGGRSYLNLLNEILPILEKQGYETNLEQMFKLNLIEDKRKAWPVFEFEPITEDYIVKNCPNPYWPEGHPMEGTPILLRDYQAEAINIFLQNQAAVEELATSFGKTITCAAMAHCCEKYGRTLVIVPNKDLVLQTEEDYINIGLDVGVYFGDRKDYGKTHTICTWQSLERMHKNDGKDDKITLDEFIDGVVCIIIDEAHTISGDSLKKLLLGPLSNIPIRWGLTGTVPIKDIERKNLVITVGQKVHEVTARYLMDRGFLSECHIDIIQLKEQMSFSDWPSEQGFLGSDVNRIKWIAEFAKVVSETGNTLILVNNIETGKMLEELIPDLDFVYGKIKSKDRKAKYKSVNTATNMIFAANYQVASTGLNIPRIFNLINVDIGKSYTRVIQSIGRGVRKAKGKDFINVFDISSNMKSSKKHLKERKNYYEYVQYPYTETKVDYISELGDNNFKTANKILKRINQEYIERENKKNNATEEKDE
ncbi:MAG: helicase [Caudoviricetes sp.]|nr:MAG: helicase [Caudoviricetes sp.]